MKYSGCNKYLALPFFSKMKEKEYKVYAYREKSRQKQHMITQFLKIVQIDKQ